MNRLFDTIGILGIYSISGRWLFSTSSGCVSSEYRLILGRLYSVIERNGEGNHAHTG